MRFLYYLILIPLSLLPSWLLYRISDGMYWVLYRMVGYRKKVVRTNLQNSFPEYAEEKRLLIERQFYGHFCDLIVESIKAFTISREELEKRFVHRNPELFPPKPWFVSHETTGLNFGTFNSCESRTYKAAC